MKPGTRSLKKYIIFPCCLLIFGAAEEIVVYKSEAITNDYLRVAAHMAFYAFGISIVAFFFTPLVERMVLKLHSTTKSTTGRPGEYLFVIMLLIAVYALWYQIIIYGPETLLPPSWR